MTSLAIWRLNGYMLAGRKFSHGTIGWYQFILLLCSVVILFLGLVVFSDYGVGNVSENVGDLDRRARQFYLTGDFIAAQNLFAQGLKKDSKNPDLLSGVIGSIAAEGSRSGKEPEAMKKAEKYLKDASKVDDRDVYVSIGYLQEINGKYDEAIKNYDKAIEKDATFASVWFHKAHALEFQGKKDESNKAYEEAFRLAPDDSLILLANGRIKTLSGKPEEGYELFIRAANETNSNRIKVEAFTNASAYKRSTGYIDEALDFSRRAVEIDNRFGPALANHGYNLVLFKGDFDEGIKYLYASMQANTRSAQPYWWIGLVYRLGKHYDDSIDYLNRAIKLVNNDNTLVGSEAQSIAKMLMTYDLATTYSLAGRRDEAIASLNAAVKLRGKAEIKAMLQKDNKNGYFKSLTSDSRFQSILN